MMAELKVTPEQLSQTSQTFANHNNTMKSILDDMMNQISSLNSQWEGEASSAYIGKFRSLESDINVIYRMINEHVRDLEEMSAAYKGAENTSVSAVGGLASNTIS